MIPGLSSGMATQEQGCEPVRANAQRRLNPFTSGQTPSKGKGCSSAGRSAQPRQPLETKRIAGEGVNFCFTTLRAPREDWTDWDRIE